MKWIWVRHGETAANAARQYLGHADIPLQESGRKQSAAITETLKIERITRLFTSDLSRTMETAIRIGEIHGLIPEPTPALRELDFGDWDLCTYEEIMQKDPERLTAWYGDPFRLAPPNGETLRELGARVDNWLMNQLNRLDRQDVIVCVSHGGPIRWFQCKWLLSDPLRFWEVNGPACGQSITADWDGSKWRQQ